MTELQRLRHDFLKDIPHHSIDVKWRNNPPTYSNTREWHNECMNAVLDALTSEGVAAWPGDATTCVCQIIGAYAKMDANLLTPQQLRELADKKEQEGKIIKVGYLKCCLYDFQSDTQYTGISFKKRTDFWLHTAEEKNKTIEQFTNHFKLVLKKGTKFVCYSIKGEELWFDDVNYGVESMNSEWANKWLENIVDSDT